MRPTRISSLLCCVVPLLALSACAAPSFQNNVYRNGRVAYRIGELGEDWRRVLVQGGQLAFHHRDGGTISVAGWCKDLEDVPLDVLTNHLLFGVEVSREERERITLDGRAALRTLVRGELDGVPIAMETVVSKKDGCTYDLQLIAGLSSFEKRQDDFERLVVGFATTPAKP